MRSFHEFDVLQCGKLSMRHAGTGAAIVLIHGFPEDGALWRHVAPALAESHSVWIPDLPGVGSSDAFPQPLTVELMADALHDALVHVPQKLLLVGHSMGGYVALAFAERFPERVAGISMVHSTALPDSDEKRAQRSKAASLLRGDGKRRFLKDAVEALFAPAFRDVHPEQVADQLERAEALDGESLAHFTQAMAARPDRTAVVKNAEFPVQWVLGDQDSVMPLDTGLQQAAFASVSFLSLYVGGGHLSPLEAPHRLAADVARLAAHAVFG